MRAEQSVRLINRVKKLEAAVPKCDGRVSRLVMEGQPITEADRCRICGGSHVLVIEEVIVTREDLEAKE